MKQTLRVCVGSAGTLVGLLQFNAEGRRESCAFEYSDKWLSRPDAYAIDPSLPLQREPFFHARPQYLGGAAHRSTFFGAIADTEPGGWGKRILRHDRGNKPATGATGKSTSLDGLLAIDDFSRLGALRYQDDDGVFLAAPEGRRAIPSLADLRTVLQAIRNVESDRAGEDELHLLKRVATALGGMRPKCTFRDTDGSLAIAKFPSVHDVRVVTKGEVLALNLARAAGINAAVARVENVGGSPVTIVRRFDRRDQERVPFISATTLIGSVQGDHTYTEIADQIRAVGARAKEDLHELWRRLAFGILIKNVDDHLNNHGFLHAGHGQWVLSPAFDVNPVPGKNMQLKTWISEDAGPSADIELAMAAAHHFSLETDQARNVLAEIASTIEGWRQEAGRAGLSRREADAFSDAFEHSQIRAAKALCSTPLTIQRADPF